MLNSSDESKAKDEVVDDTVSIKDIVKSERGGPTSLILPGALPKLAK